MSDLDPEMIEKVAIATYEEIQRPNWRAPLWGEIDELGREGFLNVARAALEAVADDLRAEGAAKALRDVAEQRCGWEIKPMTQGGWNAGGVAASAGTHDRANQIEQGGQP